MSRNHRRLSLRWRYLLAALVMAIIVATVTVFVDHWLDPAWLAAVVAVLVSLPLL